MLDEQEKKDIRLILEHLLVDGYRPILIFSQHSETLNYRSVYPCEDTREGRDAVVAEIVELLQTKPDNSGLISVKLQ